MRVPSLESRLAACLVSIVVGVAVAAFALWQVPRPDTWFLLAVASALILLGTAGVLFVERAPQASLWAAFGSISIVALAATPLVWIVTLAVNTSGEIPQTLFGGDRGGFASPFSDDRFAALTQNSAAAAAAATAIGLLIGAAVAYPLARGRMRGLRLARGFVWASLFVPAAAFVGPWSAWLADAGRLDSPFALISSSLILTVPLCAAGLLFLGDRLGTRTTALAETEGATARQRFVRVTLPTVGPGVAGVAALAFLAVWNDLLVAATVTVWRTETVGAWARTVPGPAEQSGLLLAWLLPAIVALVVAVRAVDSVLGSQRNEGSA